MMLMQQQQRRRRGGGESGMRNNGSQKFESGPGSGWNLSGIRRVLNIYKVVYIRFPNLGSRGSPSQFCDNGFFAFAFSSSSSQVLSLVPDITRLSEDPV